MKNGKFVISLDFELQWGIRDMKNAKSYSKNILGVHTVIPRLLEEFKKHRIKATFAIVGFLFFENKSEILANLPSPVPNYTDKCLSPYLGYFDQVGENAMLDLYHFGFSLIDQISKYPENEIGSHTFSHFYCMEEGQNGDDFRADIQTAKKLAQKFNIRITSLIFPRNQINNDYLHICQELGIICIRGNEFSWLYRPRNKGDESKLRRALRLLDAYINISGHNCYTDEYLRSKYPIDIPSSKFLRPFSIRFKYLERLRLNRIKVAMTYAAKTGSTYHLWWHPHNFGINQDQNFTFLNKILDHYNKLHFKYNFQNYTMSELANQIINEE